MKKILERVPSGKFAKLGEPNESDQSSRHFNQNSSRNVQTLDEKSGQVQQRPAHPSEHGGSLRASRNISNSTWDKVQYCKLTKFMKMLWTFNNIDFFKDFEAFGRALGKCFGESCPYEA